MTEINLSAYDWVKKVEEIAEEYKEITIGNAKIIKEYRPPLDYFYLKKIKLSRGYYAPALYIGNELFMSIKPSELQSQILPIKYAEGKVLVAGLGMGYYVNQIIKKENVEKVDVVEINEDVIKIYQKLFSENEYQFKLNFINEDIFKFKSDIIYDFFYIDIWSGTPKDFEIEEVFEIVAMGNIKPKRYFIWETENLIWSYIQIKQSELLEKFIRWLNLEWAREDIMGFIKYLITLK